jgi:hypothetical protein
MGLMEWFTKSDMVIHMNQSGYSSNLIEQFAWDSWEPPTAIPYGSGVVPINSIAPSNDGQDIDKRMTCSVLT